MFKIVLAICFAVACRGCSHRPPSSPSPDRCSDVTIVSRSDWGARHPKSTSQLSLPVRYVIIHHTDGSSCTLKSSCIAVARGIQGDHMDTNGWDDIGYSFLVGEDGRVYEGRGWDRVGAHTRGYNDVGIAISFMGSFSDRKPNQIALNAAKNLIKCGVDLGKILLDTKTLQKEINQYQGKLDRTFAATDELIFRDAKKDEAVRKAYKYLAALHESCGLLIKTVEETGSIAREIRDLEDQIDSESKNKTIANLEKISEDYVQMKKENQQLVAQLKGK